MISSITGHHFILIVFGTVALYYIVLVFYCGRKRNTLLSPLSLHAPAIAPAMALYPGDLVGRAAEFNADPLEMRFDLDDEDDMQVEMLDDDDAILVKEAERVVEHIQDVISHIASHPANPDEVRSKIQAVVSQYKIFQNTEYFEAINAFIAQAVESECGIRWTAQDIVPLWQ
jgi:hypothetical protein